MSKLQTFVMGDRNGRPESPRHGQPKVNQQRAQHAQAANLKVSMRPEVVRPPTALKSHGLHGRGESINQNQPASLQQQDLQPRPFGESRTRDPYDTDAESIDTTVNHSVVQVENTKVFDQQPIQPEDQEDVDESGDDEEGFEEGFFDEEGQWHEELQQYLDRSGFAEASREEQLQYLQRTQPQIFRTVDGDSYPTTTEGIPTEVDEHQEQSIGNPDPPSPSPQRLAGQGRASLSFHQEPHQSHLTLHAQDINFAPQQTSRIYQQGKQIRSQQRHESTAHGRSQSGRQHGNVEPPTSLPTSHSQPAREQELAAPFTAHARPRALTPGTQSGSPQRSSRMPSAPGDTQNPVPRIVEPGTSAKNVSATRTKVVPIFQQSLEPTPVEPSPVDVQSEHVGDYNYEVLSQMRYEELRDESFDKDPCKRDSSLPEHIRGKPLEERLRFAQHQLDPTDQAEFLSALPTTEWEDAGDWFLDQFSTIIARTREARQKKRKLAQGFEKEIEIRHQHVAKKQRVVEGAMAKMQAQGEGLVPKSPRASKSPRPRRI